MRSAWLPTTERSPEALRPRGAHVVGAQRLEHRGARLAEDHRRKAGAEHDRRQQHVAQVVDRVRGERDEPRRGQDPEPDREDQDQHQAEPEVRHRQADEGRRAAQVVRHRAAPHRREHPEREPDRDRHEQAQERELERDRQAVDDRTADAEAGSRRRAEVAAHDVAQPDDVLDRDRLVEVVLRPDRRERLLAVVLAGERQGGVARQRAHAAEHEHARDEQDDQRGAGAPHQVAARHVSDRLPCRRRPANARRGRPSGRTSTPVTSLREPVKACRGRGR